MTPQQALEMIDGILAQLKLERAPTLQLIEAVKTSARTLAPLPVTPPPDPPEAPPNTTD